MKKVSLFILVFTATRCLAQTALTPDAPVLPPSSVSPAMTAPTPALASPLGSSATTSSTNLSIAGLAQLLTGLQGQLQQTLPVLNALNNSFDFVSVGTLTNSTGMGGTGANFSSSSGANFSSNTGANVGSSVAASTINVVGFGPLNAFGLPPGLGVAPITSETLRALLVLQSDIERMLPTLNVLTGGTNGFTGIRLTPGFGPGSVTNVFVVSPTGR